MAAMTASGLAGCRATAIDFKLSYICDLSVVLRDNTSQHSPTDTQIHVLALEASSLVSKMIPTHSHTPM